jgi:hypothetical protein
LEEKDAEIAELRAYFESAAPLEGPDKQTFSSLVETLKVRSK